MKRILLGLLIVFLVIAAVLDIKDYVVGDNVNRLNTVDSGGEYEDYADASAEMEEDIDSLNVGVISTIKRMYKLPNNHYYNLEMKLAKHKLSTYMYNGFIEIKSPKDVELSFPGKEWQLVSSIDKFKQKSWKVESKAGTHEFNVGSFDNHDDLSDRIFVNDDKSAGVEMLFTPKKGVIEINDNGLWLDSGKNKVGMNESNKSYSNEKSALSAVKKDDFGKQSGVIKVEDMHLYIFRNRVKPFTELTLVPVVRKGNTFTAGQYERLTFDSEDDTDTKVTEKFGSEIYNIYFKDDFKQMNKFKNKLKEEYVSIAVEKRGEKNGK